MRSRGRMEPGSGGPSAAGAGRSGADAPGRAGSAVPTAGSEPGVGRRAAGRVLGAVPAGGVGGGSTAAPPAHAPTDQNAATREALSSLFIRPRRGNSGATSGLSGGLPGGSCRGAEGSKAAFGPKGRAGRRPNCGAPPPPTVPNRADQSIRYRPSAVDADSRMPLIRAELKPWCSISFNPAMVQPRGVVTRSISDSGWRPSFSTNEAAPLAV